jgi:hypothetical protein
MTDDDYDGIEPLFPDLESFLAATNWDEATKEEVRRDMAASAADRHRDSGVPPTLH